MFVIHKPLQHKPKCRVELHVHLDGSLRHETIWDLLRRKNLPLPGNGSLQDLKTALKVQEPENFFFLLTKYAMIREAIMDDLVAIERMAYEFVEDLSRNCVIYAEARFTPQWLLTKFVNTSTGEEQSSDEDHPLTSDDVVEAVLKGFRKGEIDFETKVCLILSCVRERSEWALDILRLCEEFGDKGVVGMSLSGKDPVGEEAQNLDFAPIFDAAKEKGIHITVHAGEFDSAKAVVEALDVLHAERIGHGYRIVEDEEIYQRCLEDGVHFEVCPHSSYCTGAIQNLETDSKRHPVLRFAEDGMSFSISTDGPAITAASLEDEYRLLQSWGFTEAHFVKANLEAAANCFLGDTEKEELMNHLTKAYGLPSQLKIEVDIDSSSSQSPSSGGVSVVQKKPESKTTKPLVQMASWGDRL